MKSARGTSPVTARQPAGNSKVPKLDRWGTRMGRLIETMGLFLFPE